MSDRAGTRPARSETRGAAWTPPHNPVVLEGPDPLGDPELRAHRPFIVRLQDVLRDDAERLQREVGIVGGTATFHSDADDGDLWTVNVGLLPERLETLRARLLAASPVLLGIVEEIALVMRCWERTAFRLRCGSRTLECGGRPLIMGVVNCTPDSFFAGSTAAGEDAVRRGEAMVAAGADLVDVGGESTRPGSEPVSAREQIGRVTPVIRALAERVDVPLSVDTTRAEVAAAALDAGASLINDISGLADDPELGELAAERDVPVILMHMRGRPKDMTEHATYDDFVAELVGELRRAVARARAAGIAEDALVVDPGIGFAKHAEHSLAALRRLQTLRSLGRPVLVGPSRKSFIGAVLDLPAEERLEGTSAAVAAAVLAGAHILRVHDVGPMRRVADMAAAIRSEGTGWIS